MAIAAQPDPTPSPPGVISIFVRLLGWTLLVPLAAVVLLGGLALWQIGAYQNAHDERFYTGVSISDIDLSGLTRDEAQAQLGALLPAIQGGSITLTDPVSGQSWQRHTADLGVAYDLRGALDAAYAIGRDGEQGAQLRAQFDAWYYGETLYPAITIDEAQVDALVTQIAAAVDRPAVDAALDVNGNEVTFRADAAGQRLDRATLRDQLLAAVRGFADAQITLPIVSVAPRIQNSAATAAAVQQIIAAPIQFYFTAPIDGSDLAGLTLPTDKLVEWLRIDMQRDADGVATQRVLLDEVAARLWLQEQAARIYREPVRARYYFDDYTRELVLVEPHVDGRELDVDATLAQLMAVVDSPTRQIALQISPIVPDANARATAEALGITELVSEATTYFAGSPPERMANIARAAANFYGIVVAPGEQFSFNHYLGEISEEQGYERGLIIAGGRTIEGIGGGVCQVSTTVFQAAFWGGFAIDERWQHGYRVHYYEDGTGPDGLGNVGMDATVYSPDIDFKFTNNTPHHLLIENYYNEGNQSLTFKMYSTSIGRTVERTVSIWNETEARPDIYEFNPEWQGEDLNQVDWAVGGASVLVTRTVYNQWGEVRHQDNFLSEYIPWANIYEYGPNTAARLRPGSGQ